jgi:hypothetical protein
MALIDNFPMQQFPKTRPNWSLYTTARLAAI